MRINLWKRHFLFGLWVIQNHQTSKALDRVRELSGEMLSYQSTVDDHFR